MQPHPLLGGLEWEAGMGEQASWNGSSLLQQAGMNRLEGLETTSLIQPGFQPVQNKLEYELIAVIACSFQLVRCVNITPAAAVLGTAPSIIRPRYWPATSMMGSTT